MHQIVNELLKRAVIDMSREDRMAFTLSHVGGRPFVKWPP